MAEGNGNNASELEDCFVFGLMKEKVDTVVQDAVVDVLDGKAFDASKISEWQAALLNQCVSDLEKLSLNFKYVVTCFIRQRKGGGLHSESTCYWDDQMDGVCTVSWENKTFSSASMESTADLCIQKAARASHKKRQLKLDLHLVLDKQNSLSDAKTIDTIDDSVENQNSSSIKPRENKVRANSISELTNDGPANLARDVYKADKLGRGAGGTVYLGIYLPRIKLVAIKKVSVHDTEERKMIAHELHALHVNLVPIDDDDDDSGELGIIDKLRKNYRQAAAWSFHKSIGSPHPCCKHIVSFYGAFSEPNESKVSIVMEYMSAGSLQDLLQLVQRSNSIVPEVVLRRIAFCSLKALQHMHKLRMIHRDIKPANILANHFGEFKIADFGLAATLSKSKSFISDFKGTMMYMAPERLRGEPYSYPSDVWSVGMVLATLALGKFPYSVSEGFFGLEDAVVNDDLPNLPCHYSPSCRSFIVDLLQKDPALRPSADAGLKNEFFQGTGASAVDPPCDTFKMACKDLFPPSCTSNPETLERLADHIVIQRQKSMSANPATGNLWNGYQSIFGIPNSHNEAVMSNREIQNFAHQCGVSAELMSDIVDKVTKEHQ